MKPLELKSLAELQRYVEGLEAQNESLRQTLSAMGEMVAEVGAERDALRRQVRELGGGVEVELFSVGVMA